MLDAEWRLSYPGTDLTFGTSATAIFNRTTPVIGDADIRNADVDRPRADGKAFGVDFFGGQNITFDLGVRAPTEPAVRAEVSALRAAWRADAVRKTPGAVAELHTRYAGRERVAYGRPRRFAPDFTNLSLTRIASVTADFACVDDLFYGAQEITSPRIGTVTRAGGGLLAPLRSPLSTTVSSDRSVVIDVETDLPAWPIIEINGPITNPVVEVVGVFRIEVKRALAYDETLIIDTRPWKRTAILNDSGSIAGAVRGTRLSDAALNTGSYEVALRGDDLTGTADAFIRWRATYPSL